MTEVRRHQRQTASGKTTTVRRYTRGTGEAAAKKRQAWEERAAARWTPPPAVGDVESAPADEGEPWWDEEHDPHREEWMDDDPPPSQGFLDMQAGMRDWRGRDIEVPAAEPDTSPLGRALGNDTPEGAAKFARLKAYREAGYDGPLDSDNRIPDPDDPRERPALEALAHMRTLHG